MTGAGSDGAGTSRARGRTLVLTGVAVLVVLAGAAVLLGGRREAPVDLRQIDQLNAAVIPAVDAWLATQPLPLGADGVPLIGGRTQSSICVPTPTATTFLCTVQFTDVYDAVLMEVRISDDARSIVGLQERPAY